MTDEELQAIRERCASYEALGARVDAYPPSTPRWDNDYSEAWDAYVDEAFRVAMDVPALLAEVDRLRAAVMVPSKRP